MRVPVVSAWRLCPSLLCCSLLLPACLGGSQAAPPAATPEESGPSSTPGAQTAQPDGEIVLDVDDLSERLSGADAAWVRSSAPQIRRALENLAKTLSDQQRLGAGNPCTEWARRYAFHLSEAIKQQSSSAAERAVWTTLRIQSALTECRKLGAFSYLAATQIENPQQVDALTQAQVRMWLGLTPVGAPLEELTQNSSSAAAQLIAGEALLSQGSTEPAKAAIDKAAATLNDSAPLTLRIALESERAALAKAQKNLPAAEQALKTALELSKSGSYQTGANWMALGRLHQEQGKAIEAAEAFSTAVSVWERLLGENHLFVADALEAVGQALSKTDQRAEGRQALQEAHRIKLILLGQSHPEVERLAAALPKS